MKLQQLNLYKSFERFYQNEYINFPKKINLKQNYEVIQERIMV